MTPSKNLTTREQEEIVTSPLLNMCKAGENSIERFESRAKAKQASLLRTPKRKFHLLTAVRAVSATGLPKGNVLSTRVGSVSVRFPRACPKKADLGPLRFSESETIDLQHSRPFVPVWATLQARDEVQAADQAIDAIKAVLGCINLALNYNVERHHS